MCGSIFLNKMNIQEPTAHSLNKDITENTHSQTAAPTAGRPASGRREQISRFTQRTMGRLKGAPRALFGPAPARPTSARELTPVTLAIVAAHFGAGHKGARKPCRVRKDGGADRVRL